MNWTDTADIALYLTAGAGLGAVYFYLLSRAVRQHATRGITFRIIPLYLLRIAAAAVAFWMIAQQGALPLLLALLGFLAARHAAQRWPTSEQ